MTPRRAFSRLCGAVAVGAGAFVLGGAGAGFVVEVPQLGWICAAAALPCAAASALALLCPALLMQARPGSMAGGLLAWLSLRPMLTLVGALALRMTLPIAQTSTFLIAVGVCHLLLLLIESSELIRLVRRARPYPCTPEAAC